MFLQKINIDQIAREKTTLDGSERIPGRDDDGDFKTNFGIIQAKLLAELLDILKPGITDSATLTGSDNKIVMTGIVSALGLEIGDVIQIQYSGYDKLHTVEIITDDDTIVVNYEHCGGRGNGSLKLQDYTGEITVKRIAKWYNAPIGLGQAWVNLPSSVRTHSTNYTNSTNRTIFVFTKGSAAAGQRIKVDQRTRSEIGYGGSWTGVVPTPILPGESYIENVGTVTEWTEIR